MKWYLYVLSNYVGFRGRARRTEFWMFTLCDLLIAIVLGALGYFLDFPYLLLGYLLLTVLPRWAVGVRRLHDTGRSGAWLLINLVPVVGWIVGIVFAEQPGVVGPNKYGADPKQVLVHA